MDNLNKSTHYITALFLALFVGFFYAQNMDTTLLKPGAILGIATLDGIDVNQRISSFYKMVFLTGIAFFGFAIVLNKQMNAKLHHWVLPLSVVGIMNLTFSFYNPDNFLVSLVVLGLLLSLLIPVKQEDSRLFYVSLSVSVTIFSTYFLRISGTGFNAGFVVFIWFIILLLILGLANKTRLFDTTKNLKPLLLLPVIEPLGNETFLILNQREMFLTTPIGWVLIYFILLLIWVFIQYKKNQLKWANPNQNWVFGFVFSIAVFGLYQPYYSFWGDLFELANPANAMMRHFVFGEFPFVDYFSSHVLFEQIPQWVYVLLNGYHADVSFMIYAFLVPVLGMVILFWFFQKLLGTEWALMLLFLFPFTDVLIPPTFVFGLITIQFIYTYFATRTTKSVYTLLFSILFITLWRIDFGASIIPAVVFLFILEWIQSRSFSEIKKVLIHSIIFIGILGITAFVINLIFDGKLFENLPLALEYLGASQAHAYTELAKKFTSLFYLHYFVFPIVSVIIIIHILGTGWKQKSRLEFTQITTVFLGLIYLFNAQRGLVRHSFTEEYDLYISSVFFLFIATWMLRFYSKNKGLFFTVFSFLFILGFHYSTHGKPKSFANTTIQKAINSTGIKNTQERIERVKVADDFDREGYQRMANFINVNLKANQTFIDFSHTPLLYFLTQQKVPSYFNQYIQNTVTPKLLKHNVANLENIGLVVFGHSPSNPIDALDGVPNELRYLPVTEYIYQNFSPFTVVNGFRIWMPKEAGFGMEDSTKMLPVMHDKLRNLPSYLGRTENFEPVSDVVLAGNEVILFDHTPDIHDAFAVNFESIPSNSNHTAWMQCFDDNHQLLGEVEFKLKPIQNATEFVVPVGYQYQWLTKEVAKIEFHYPEYLVLKSIKLVRYEP